MQRKKPYETQLNSKETNIENKIITRTIRNLNLDRNIPSILTLPSIQQNTEIKSKDGQMIKEIQNISNFNNYEIKNNPIPHDKRIQKNKIYLSSRYNNNKRQIEKTPNLAEQISMNDEINDFNLFSIKSKKASGIGESLFSNQKEIKNYNIKLNMNPAFEQEINNNMKINTNESIKINSSSINNKYGAQYTVIPQTKLSPIEKCEEGSCSFDNKKFSEKKNRITNNINSNGINNQNINIESIYLNTSNLNNNFRKGSNPEDNRNTQGRIITDVNSPSYNNERAVSQNSNSNTVSKKELKRIVKKFNKVYDPYRNEKGILLKQSQITLPGASDEIFNNRYRVLSKMNKLSNILLSKQKKEEENNSSRENSPEININNIFDRHRSRSKNGSHGKNIENGGINKQRNSNIKEITILRKNRMQKGGVVDLAQEEIKKNKFKIVKASAPKGGRTYMKINSKYKEKAAKIIQGWWRELKDIYEYKLAQIIKIQSFWRGRWVRRNIYDLLYLNYLYLSFCEKIEKILTNKITRYAFDKLILYQKYSFANSKEDILKKLVFHANKRRITIIRKYWDKWIDFMNNEKLKKNKGKTLLQIRADKDNKLSKLRNAFTIWKYNTKMANIKNKYKNNTTNNIDNDENEIREEINMNGKKVIKITKIEEKERYITPMEQNDFIGKNKFKGLLKILEGANNYQKKEAFETTAPRIKKYLTELAKTERLRYLINKKHKIIQQILRKALNKWINRTILMKSTLNGGNLKQKEEYDKLRTKIFLNRVENLKNKRKKTILRKYFYKYLKNAFLIKNKGKNLDNNKINNSLNSSNNKPEEEYDFNFNKYVRNSLHPYAKKKSSEKINQIKYINFVDILEGCKKLEKYTWRNTYIDILNNFKEKIKERKINIQLIKIIKIYEKTKRQILKDFFNKWKNNTFRRKNNDIITRMFIKIIKIIIANNTKKILSKRFNQWRNNVRILKGKNNTFLKSKNTYDFIEHLKKYINRKYLSDLLDKLKLLRKENMIYDALLKILIRYENKNDRNLMRNALNKWKRIISNEKIENLKGKLLLKLYDKFKTNKIKDALKKYLSIWENNTIFLDKITTIISEETTTIYRNKNKNDKIIILLKSIIRNLNRKNNDNNLRKYFNIWKNNIKINKKNLTNNIKEAFELIKKLNIKNNGKYLNDSLKSNKRRIILKNILTKYGKPKNIILNYYLSRWLFTSKKIAQIEFSIIIQEFTRRRLRERNIIRKWKKLYYLLKREISNENRYDIIQRMNYYIKIKKLINALKGNNKGNIYDKHFASYFIKKLKGINEKNNMRNQILYRILNKNDNKTRNNILKNAINKWRKKISDSKIEKLKGKLLLKIYDKFKLNKNKAQMKKYLSKWENNTIFIDKITTIISEETTTIYKNKNQKDKRKILLKSIIRNLYRKNNDNNLRKFFNIWKKNIKDNNINSIKNLVYTLSEIFYNSKNKNGKKLFDKLKDNKKTIILRNVLKKYGKPKSTIIDYYFQRWKYINKKSTQIDNDTIIQQFIRKKLKNLAYYKKWMKLYSLLRKQIDKDEIGEIIILLKYLKGLSKLFGIIKNHNKKDIFNKLKNNKNYTQITTILIEIIKTIENKNNNNLLRKYFDIWKNYVSKDNDRLNALIDMLDILEKKNIKNSVNCLSDVFTINKLMKNIEKVRALQFLKKIKNKGEKQNLYNNLSNNLINAKDDMINKNSKLITEKIYKMYFYTIISKFVDYLSKIQNSNKKVSIEEFFDRLYQLTLSKAEYKYTKQSQLDKEPMIFRGVQISKKSNKNPKEKNDKKMNKVIVYRGLVPNFVKYLNKIFKRRNYEIFEKIKNKNLGYQFTKLLKSFAKESNIPDKEDLVDSLKYYVYMKLSKISDSNKLYNLIRKAIIRKILMVSKSTGNLCRLYHLVNMTLTHKYIAKDRWILKIIKRWRFITFVKKMAERKMELMYKNLHVTYLEMADSVLKETSPIESRFLPDINMDKYLFNFNDPYLIEGSNAYKGIKKKYVFQPLDNEIEKNIKEIKEIKTIEKYKEITKTNYNDKDYSYSYKKSEIKNEKSKEKNSAYNDEEEEEIDEGRNTYKTESRDNYYNKFGKNSVNEEFKSSGKKFNFSRYPGSSSYFRGSQFDDNNE